MHALLQDLRYGLRMFAKKPGFTAIAVATFALGIGLSTAVFSVVYGMALRPLGYPQQDRLVYIFAANPIQGWQRVYVSCLDFFDWRRENESFVDMGIFYEESRTLTGGDRPEWISLVRASASLLPVLGFDARIGRLFGPEEDQAGRGDVVLLADSFWKRRFGGDPSILGQNVTLDGVAHTVLGVLPPQLENAWGRFEMWSPSALDPADFSRGSRSFRVIGRLKPGVDLAQAQTEMEGIAARLAQAYPDTNTGRTVEVVGLMDIVLGEEGKLALWALMAAVTFVLLIACVNVANLLLARGIVRHKEFAVRAALGAGRWRLIRQLITECTLLSLLGAGLGVLLAVWGVDLLVAALPDSVPRKDEIAVNWQVLAFALVLSLATAVLSSLLPAFRILRVDVNDVLKDASRSATTGRSRRLRNDLLTVGQLGTALALVVCAGLMAKSFLLLKTVDPGFDTGNLLTMRLRVPEYKYKNSQQVRGFFEELTAKIHAIPGVESAAAATNIPLSGYPAGTSVTIEGYTPPSPDRRVVLGHIVTTPGYFETVGIPLLSGREFTEHDTMDSQGVAIVNERTAKRFWPREDPVGKRLKYGAGDGDAAWLTVIGVVGAIKQAGLSREADEDMYRPHAQLPGRSMALCLRTTGEPLSATAAVRNAVGEIDPDQAVYAVRSLDQIIFDEIGQWGVFAGLLSVFGAVAVALAAVGLYGVMSFTVNQRTHEIGVRIALGARSPDILRLVLGRSALLSSIGVVIGIGLALLLGQGLESLMFGVSPTDPTTLVGVAVMLIVVALLASYLPARRATKVDPMVALRWE